MPYAQAKPCRHPGCPALTHDGYCPEHALLYTASDRRPDTRCSSSRRGYDATWRRVREDILRSYGIPKELWTQYDVDHCPAYNPAVEPDHRKYTLTPRLHGDHSRKTVRHDGGWGNPRGVGGSKSLLYNGIDRCDEVNIFAREYFVKGSGK